MSSEVDAAVGEGPTREKNKSATEALTEKRAKLTEARTRYQTAKQMRDEEAMSGEMTLISSLTALLPELEAEAAAEREQIATQRAQARMVGIKKAHGSLANELEQDEKRVVEKIAELQAALARLNDRYTKAATLRAEAAALSDRFAIDKLVLPSLVPPVRREFVSTLVTLDRGLLDHPSIRQPAEECEHRLRTRRTYQEIAEGSEGFAIIQAAGLKPFPALSEKQRDVVEGRERQQEETRRQFARHAGEARERTWDK